MLIIIPLLTVNDPDVSLSLGVQFVHALGMQNSTDPATYSVRTITTTTAITATTIIIILVLLY